MKILDITINEYYSYDALVSVVREGVGVDYQAFKLYKSRSDALNCLKYWHENKISGCVFYYEPPTADYPDCWILKQVLID